MTGKVYLVGAGPGDPDLITVKAMRLIASADVIVYDRLIPAEVLDYARDHAELIDAGKAPTKHRLSQDVINHILIDRARVGAIVVRLKGGDPFVFGRGGEEALACRDAGIPFEVVPGVSSAIAVPAYAGIPVTQRNISAVFTVITGHEDPSKDGGMLNYEAAAKMGGTLIVLMGAEKLRALLARLIEAGLDPDTPAASIEWGTTDAQRVIVGTVTTLPDLAVDAGIQPPATTIIGEVVRLRDQGVEWFEDVLAQNTVELISGSLFASHAEVSGD
jgi:uroporphyrin-III C-methyltransferase